MIALKKDQKFFEQREVKVNEQLVEKIGLY